MIDQPSGRGTSISETMASGFSRPASAVGVGGHRRLSKSRTSGSGRSRNSEDVSKVGKMEFRKIGEFWEVWESGERELMEVEVYNFDDF